ncbi:octanoyltransferase [Striga asiatica]|uniref:Octanoyltransferase n=1 Tax=Striga asiatica TaxID=4170 RepID=A0A5A7Q1Y8_STRAF|nr:octanoyltransferase [Striga asiatica]
MVSLRVFRARNHPSARPVCSVCHPSCFRHLQRLQCLILNNSLPAKLHGLDLFPSIIRIRPATDRVRKTVYPNLELIILTLDPPTVLDEILTHLILERVLLQAEVRFRISRLDIMFPAERDPKVRETCSLSHGLKFTNGGSFSGSAVETNMSTPGRSDFPVGLAGLGVSNLSFSTLRSVARLIGHNLGSWSSNQEKANQISHTTDMNHNHLASSFGWLTLHARNSPRTAIRTKIKSLLECKLCLSDVRKALIQTFGQHTVVPIRAEHRGRNLQLTGERPPRLSHHLRGLAGGPFTLFILLRPYGIPIPVSPLGLKKPPVVVKVDPCLAPHQARRLHQRQPPLHLGQRERWRRRVSKRDVRVLVRLLAAWADAIPCLEGIVEAVAADLEIAVTREDIGPTAVGHDLAIAALDGARRALDAGHLWVAGLRLHHLIHEVGTGDAVVASREEGA